MNKKNVRATLIGGGVLVGVIALVVCVGIFLPRESEIIQGEVEVTDYRLSSKVPARVLEIRVEEGDHVKRGDTLVVLDAPDVDARLRQAEAAYHAAVAQEQKGAMGEVRSYVNETMLLASADGMVTEIFPEVGEFVGAGAPLMNVACLHDFWFTFNVREDLLGVFSFSLCGLTFPVSAMDAPLQVLSWLIPMHHYYVIYANQALDGYSIAYAWQHVVALLCFLLLPPLVLRRYRLAFLRYKYVE